MRPAVLRSFGECRLEPLPPDGDFLAGHAIVDFVQWVGPKPVWRETYGKTRMARDEAGWQAGWVVSLA